MISLLSYLAENPDPLSGVRVHPSVLHQSEVLAPHTPKLTSCPWWGKPCHRKSTLAPPQRPRALSCYHSRLPQQEIVTKNPAGLRYCLHRNKKETLSSTRPHISSTKCNKMGLRKLLMSPCSQQSINLQ